MLHLKTLLNALSTGMVFFVGVGEATGEVWAGRFWPELEAGRALWGGDARALGGGDVTGGGASPPLEGGDAPSLARRRLLMSSGSSGFIFAFGALLRLWAFWELS